MRIWICGVRGSTPTPGSEFVRHGGHTSCLAVALDGERPSLIVDAGTGIRLVSDLFKGSPDLFDGRAYEGAILLGHMHWDHTQGLPFFAAGNSAGSRVDLYVPAQGDTESVLGRFMSPPHFPIAPSGLLGAWSFNALEPGEAVIEGLSVLALEIPHKGGRTFGYRISDGRTTIAYLSDHCPTTLGPGPEGLGEYHEAALSLASGCDLLFHDAQYTDEELPASRLFRSRLFWVRCRAGRSRRSTAVAALPSRPGADRRPDRRDRRQLHQCRLGRKSCGARNRSGPALVPYRRPLGARRARSRRSLHGARGALGPWLRL